MWETLLQFVLPRARGEYYDRNMPLELKQEALKEVAKDYELKVMVETGTYLGETVEAMAAIFENIYSVELAPELYEKAKIKFADKQHIHILKGDSTKVLPVILSEIEKPALFWLDGHYSFGNTARGDKDTPIVEELAAIFAHHIKKHVIYIDDARCFNGTYFYPTQREVVAMVEATGNYGVRIWNDIFRITPK